MILATVDDKDHLYVVPTTNLLLAVEPRILSNPAAGKAHVLLRREAKITQFDVLQTIY